ncbi:MAG: N-acetyltransferase [Candidatus Diapherotrites archaeon]
MKVEEARAEDVAELTELIAQEFPYTKITEQKVWDKIDNPHFLLLKAADKKHGIIGFTEFQALDHENGIARLNNITVLKEFRGKDYSKSLLSLALKETKALGYKKIILLVKENNKTAKSLYKGAGFKKLGMHEKLIDGDKVEEWELLL